jgi:IS4 transposase
MEPGEMVICDRGYAHRKGLHAATAAGGHFIVRLNWKNLPLTDPGGGDVELLGFLRSLPEAAPGEKAVVVAACPRDGLPALPARLVALRSTEAAAEAARARVLRASAKKGHAVDPRSLETAGYLFVLASLPPAALPAAEVLELYRFRWQVELTFKRLKSLLHLAALPARDPPLARTFLYAKLLAALLLEDFTDRFLAFSPWGYRLATSAAFPVAHPTGAA